MSALLDALAAQAAARPAAVALADGELVLGYADLFDMVSGLAAALAARPPRALGLLADNSVAWALTDLAAQAAGIPVVPLPTFFSDHQLAHALRAAGVDRVVTDCPERLPRLFGSAALGKVADFCGALQWLTLDVGDGAAPLPSGTRKITFTSGTTGEPKGVCLGEAALARVAQSLQAASCAGADDRHLCLLPLATLLENIGGIHVPLLAGACVHLPRLRQVGLQGSSGLDVGRLLAALAEREITTAILVPQMLHALVAALEAGAPVPPRLRYLAVGGAPVSARLLIRAEELGLPVFEGYGLSECASVVAVNRPGERRVGSVGKPLPHLNLRFAADGEILVGGNAFLGYLGETAGSGSEPLATGDLGYLDGDGYLHLTGRKKNMFVTAFGRNVAPEWVESELAATRAIAQAALFGEAMPFNVAVLVPRPGATAGDVDDAIARVNRSLPDYARIGAWLPVREAFSLANGQLTANGRLRRTPIWQCHAQDICALLRKENHELLC